MPRVQWPLSHDRPCVHVVLTLAQGGQPLSRTLLADTGAGSRKAAWELILDEDDCLLCGGFPYPSVTLKGAYLGSFPIYDLRVASVPAGFDGISQTADTVAPKKTFEQGVSVRLLPCTKPWFIRYADLQQDPASRER